MSGTGNTDTWAVGERDTVIAALERAVARHPDKVLLDFSGELYTYRETDLLSTKMAHSLASLGVQAGETVLTMLDNNIDAVVTWLAINKLRAVSVPINTALKGEFLRHQIADTNTKVVICEAAYLDRIVPLASKL
ncbi:AMP-binding protein, partial [Pseudomonas sp. LM13]